MGTPPPKKPSKGVLAARKRARATRTKHSVTGEVILPGIGETRIPADQRTRRGFGQQLPGEQHGRRSFTTDELILSKTSKSRIKGVKDRKARILAAKAAANLTRRKPKKK